MHEPMKNALLFSAFAFVLTGGCASVQLNGTKYYGKPAVAGKTGFEGAGQRGQFSFEQDKVTFILPGSDERSAGTYTVSGETVTIKDLTGKTYTLELKESGRILQSGSETYRRSDYSW